MIDAACVATSQVSGVERFDRLVDAKLCHRPVNEGLEGLVNHRGAPTCVVVCESIGMCGRMELPLVCVREYGLAL